MYRKITLCVTIITIALGFGGNIRLSDSRLSPRLLNYQGYLTDTLGNPVTNPSLSLSFAIFDSPSAGTQKWSETQGSIAIDKGIFNVLLGSVTPIPDSIFTNSISRYLQLTVAGQVLSPRTQIVATPYAYTAIYSDTAQYSRNSASDNDWSFRVTDVADTTLQTGGRWGLARAGNVLYGNADSTHVNFGVDCTTGTSGLNYKCCVVAGGRTNIASKYAATVSGGDCNTASGDYATVGGGNHNVANNGYATVGGGNNNIVSTNFATVGGGDRNMASGLSATVSGGVINIANGYAATIGGGRDNNTNSSYATVGGGDNNIAESLYTTIGGGVGNIANGYSATVSGGTWNFVNNAYATISGGYADTVDGWCGSVGGGYDNIAADTCAAVSGGRNNRARGKYSVVGGGGGSVKTDSNAAIGDWSTIGGGKGNRAHGDYVTIAGGMYNHTDSIYGSVGGGYSNAAKGRYATVGGGSSNYAAVSMSTIAGGNSNEASGGCAAVGGGYANDAVSPNATVGGGYQNIACGDYGATVSGGMNNIANGYGTTVAGGWRDTVDGYCGFAANYSAKVNAADTNSAAFTTSHTTAANQVRAAAFSTGTLDFAMDHPADPMNKILNQYAISSDEIASQYRGSVILDAGGRAVVRLPDYFDDINRDPMIQLTGVGSSDVYVFEKIRDNRFVVGGKPGIEVYWEVTAERADIHAEIARIQTPVVQEKTGDLRGHSIDDDAMVGIYDGLHQKNPALFQFKTEEGRGVHEQSKQPVGSK